MSHCGVGRISLASRAETPMMPLEREVEPKTAEQLMEEGSAIKAALVRLASQLDQWEIEADKAICEVGGIDSPRVTPEIQAIFDLYVSMPEIERSE